MLFWPFLFIQLAISDDFSVEEYCFSSPASMQSAAIKAKIVLVPSDETSQDGSCLTVKARIHRRELIQNYVRNIDPLVRIQFSSSEIRRELCELKVEKIRNLKLDGRDISLKQNSTLTASQNTGQAAETLQIKTLNDFELSANQDVIKGTCRYLTPDRYEISLEVRKDPKPLYPGLPAGTVILINNPPPPPDQQTSRLTTTVQLNKGQRIEIGSVIKDLKNQSNKVDISQGIGHQDNQGFSQEQVFLSIE